MVWNIPIILHVFCVNFISKVIKERYAYTFTQVEFSQTRAEMNAMGLILTVCVA